MGFFFGVSFGVVFSSLLGGPKTVLEPNMAPTWVDFGAMLGSRAVLEAYKSAQERTPKTRPTKDTKKESKRNLS